MSFEPHAQPAAILTHLGAIFVSLELSQSIWLVTSVSPGAGEKMSKHRVEAGDAAGLLALFAELRRKALARTARGYPIIVIQEAGCARWRPRRRRRAKTDKIDGETLVRTLLAFKRGEPRVCSMARPPTPEDEDRRRVSRERKALIAERIQHVNRIKGLLFSQGVRDYQPLRRDRRRALEGLRTGDGRDLAPRMKAQIGRELDRLELLMEQIAAVEDERDAMLSAEAEAGAQAGRAGSTPTAPTPVAMLAKLKSVGPEFAAVLWTEGLCRTFANRRQVAAYAGLAPTPWQSGSIDREQGVSKAGNPRLRTTMIQLAWLWVRHQPQSELSRWFRERLAKAGSSRRKTTIVALARKLLVALWKYATAGVVIEGAVLKKAAA